MTNPAPTPATEPTPQNPAPQPQNPAPAQPVQPAQPAQPAEPAQPQNPAPGDTVNRHKYERDIAKVEAERDAARAEAEDLKGFKAEFEEWKASQAKEKVEADLKAAGCHDVVAASARLQEFDGDIEKLKEAAPYLFTSTDNTKRTGGNPKGTPDPEDERTNRMREIMGLKDKE